MDIQSEISWIQNELLKVKDPDLILAFKSMLKYRNKNQSSDWWNELSIVEKQEVEKGINEAERGELKSHEEVMKKYEGRF